MRVPDLDWPADLFTDVPMATPVAVGSAAAPFWATMLAPPMQVDDPRALAWREAERMGELATV